MKHIINYTPEHKVVLENAINMALKWHEGNIDPVCEVMFRAFKRHHPNAINPDETLKLIRRDVGAIRNIDSMGESFGKYEILSTIKLSDGGETALSEEAALALEHLSEAVSRLIASQVEICFEWFNIPHLDHEKDQELRRLADGLHTLCWNKPPNASYGFHYSEESDTLWDIYQVLRHERYLNFSEEDKKAARWTVMADSPLHSAPVPLMKIKTIKEE